MSKLKVTIIGAGNLATLVHYPSLTEFDDVEIVGICDLNSERLSSAAQRFGIDKTFDNYHTMLDTTAPDAVYTLMPPYHLFDIAMDVLERGHALFVEKPPALTTHQARCLARRATEKRVITAVGFQRRYHPAAHQCWEQVKAKGEIHQVQASFYKLDEPSELHPYYRGAIDILTSDAIHAVDAIRYYTGLADVTAVSSQVANLDSWYAVAFNALIQFSNGAMGILTTNWRSGGRFFKFEFHGYGSVGFADIEGESTVWANDGVEPVHRSNSVESAESDQMHHTQGFKAESRAFLDAVKSGTPPHNDLQDAVKSMELVDMIYRNAINR